MPRTVGEVIQDVAGRVPTADELAAWPPDLFAITSAILAESGAYRAVVSPPGECVWPVADPDAWAIAIETFRDEWIEWCEDSLSGNTIPGVSPILAAVQALFLLRTLDLSLLAEEAHWGQLCLILDLHALADEACVNIGLGERPAESDALYLFRANDLLSTRGSLSNFDPERLRVLPKMRTPQAGISIRSISHHAAFVRCEVGVRWVRRDYPRDELRRDRLRLLIFPWPFSVAPRDFVPVPGPLRNLDPSKFGFFEFCPEYRTVDLQRMFSEVLRRASDSVGPLDGVVLPECAVTDEEFELLWWECNARGINLLLGGVRGHGTNEARLKLGLGNPPPFVQHKHHRWCLDESQIRNYGIGAALNPALRWWEAMTLQRRDLTFVALNDWLTISHLICEDLARLDPVAQVVRAVGPTLLIALLLDGPQLSDRWSARYASVLADDPGTSVLTVTALGMALRSCPPGRDPNPTIAFWRDAKFGNQPIRLEPGSAGVVLTLWPERVEEFSADGRSDGAGAGRVIFGGITQVSAP